MTHSNNAYLYNFIFASYLTQYDSIYTPILGFDSSFALYLFQYSKELFFTYPYKFLTSSITTNSYSFLNICDAIVHGIPNISDIEHIQSDRISFKYFNKFDINIYHTNNYYQDLFVYNEPFLLDYNGLSFYCLPIECIMAYQIYLYSQFTHSVAYIHNIITLISIYYHKILANNILIYLLMLKTPIQKTIKNLIKYINKLSISDIDHLDFDISIIKERTISTLKLCYE